VRRAQRPGDIVVGQPLHRRPREAGPPVRSASAPRPSREPASCPVGMSVLRTSRPSSLIARRARRRPAGSTCRLISRSRSSRESVRVIDWGWSRSAATSSPALIAPRRLSGRGHSSGAASRQWSRARARRPRRRAQRRATPCSSSRDPDRRAALARLTLGDLGTAAGLGRPARRDPRGSRSGERHHDGMRPDEDEVAVDEVGVGRWTEARGRCLRIDIAEWQAAFCTRNVNDLVVCQPTREFFWWPAS